MQYTQYISTRGQMAPAGFTDVLLAGLARRRPGGPEPIARP